MDWYYAIPLGVLLAAVIWLLLKSEIPAKRLISVAAILITFVIIIQFDPEAITKLKLASVEIEQSVEQVTNIRDEIRGIKSAIDSTEVHIHNVAISIDSTKEDLATLSRNSYEIMLLNQMLDGVKSGQLKKPSFPDSLGPAVNNAIMTRQKQILEIAGRRGYSIENIIKDMFIDVAEELSEMQDLEYKYEDGILKMQSSP